MTPHQTLAVTVRLFTLWLFFITVPNLIGTYEKITYDRDSGLLHQPLLWALGIILLICLLLWFFPLVIAKRLLPISTTFYPQAPEFESWFSVGCSLIGVWLLVTALPSLLGYISAIYIGQSSFSEVFKGPINGISYHILMNIIQLIMGIWLFIGGKGLKKILNWARHA
jgi:hypothetical protein